MVMPNELGQTVGPSYLLPATIVRYTDAAAALHGGDAKLFSAETGHYFRRFVCRSSALSPAEDRRADLISDMRSLILVYADGPRHARLKRVIRASLSARVSGSASKVVDETVHRLLDRVASRGRMDVVRDFAGPLPAIVIAQLLGLPLDHLDRLKQWSDDLAAIVGPDAGTPAKLARARQSASEIDGYLRAIVAARRAQAGDDLISDLIVRGERTGLIEGEDELIANIAFLLVAGHESTASLIASGILLLLQHPDQLARLKAEPGLIDGVVRESLRLESPVQMVARVTADGRRRLVRVLLGRANQDQAAYADPDRFDIGRYQRGAGAHPPPHLAFGAGEHRCLGAALAVMEARSAIGALVQRFPHLALDGDPIEWLDSRVFRSLKSLPVTFRPVEPGASSQ